MPARRGRLSSSASHITWLALQGQFLADGSVHVIGKEYDLHAPRFGYFRDTHQLSAPGPITGRLGQGQVMAKNLVYDVKTDDYTCGPVSWQGKAVVDPGNPDKSGPSQVDEDNARPWNFDSPKWRQVHERMAITICNHGNRWPRYRWSASIISTPKFDYDQTSDVITCEGPVKYWVGQEENIHL